MKKNSIIVIVILSIVILGLCVFIAYDKNLFGVKGENKKESNTVETKKDDKNNSDLVEKNETAYVVEGYNKRVSWSFPESFSPNESEKTIDIVNQAVLPKINIDTDNAKKFNAKIMNDYKEITNIIDSGKYSSDSSSVTACHVDYDYSINDDIIFVLVTNGCINYRGGGRTTHIGYYYDIKNDRELSIQEVCNKFGITIDEINEKIASENNVRSESSSKVEYVNSFEDTPAIMTFANEKMFEVYVETSMELYIAYLYIP